MFVVVGLIHASAPGRLLAQAAGATELRPVRITTPPKLDGILDDEAWSGALNLRNSYQFTPRFFVRAVAQFDSSRTRVLGDFLASFELSPGTVVHAGYGSLFGRELEGLDFDRYRATARALFFKASYLARF